MDNDGLKNDGPDLGLLKDLYRQEQCCKSKQTHIKAGDGSDSSDEEPVTQSTSVMPPAAAAAAAAPEPEDLSEVCLMRRLHVGANAMRTRAFLQEVCQNCG